MYKKYPDVKTKGPYLADKVFLAYIYLKNIRAIQRRDRKVGGASAPRVKSRVTIYGARICFHF